MELLPSTQPLSAVSQQEAVTGTSFETRPGLRLTLVVVTRPRALTDANPLQCIQFAADSGNSCVSY